MKFPLSSYLFPPLDLDDDDADLLRQIDDEGVAASVHDYNVFVNHCHGDVLDDLRHNWKLIKQRGNLAVYQDDATDAAYGSPSPTSVLLCVGSIPGTLDELMRSVVSHTADDAMLKSSCIGDNVVDCCVVSSLISPSAQDPCRSLTLKWAVNAGPALTRPFLQPRDFVYIESTGITTNVNGERLGFHMVHSVDIPGYLETPKLVRGRVSLYHIYRQSSPNTVEVHLRAFWELNGQFPPAIQTYFCVAATISIRRLHVWSKVKRLLLLQRSSDCGAKNDAKCCKLCKRWLGGVFAPSRCCFVCSAATCWRCSVSKPISTMSNRTVVVKRQPICRRCLRESVSKPHRSLARLMSRAPSTTSTASLVTEASSRSATCRVPTIGDAIQ